MSGQGYFDRAMRAGDRRYARLLRRLGYAPPSDTTEDDPSAARTKTDSGKPEDPAGAGKRNKYETRRLKAGN